MSFLSAIAAINFAISASEEQWDIDDFETIFSRLCTMVRKIIPLSPEFGLEILATSLHFLARFSPSQTSLEQWPLIALGANWRLLSSVAKEVVLVDVFLSAVHVCCLCTGKASNSDVATRSYIGLSLLLDFLHCLQTHGTLETQRFFISRLTPGKEDSLLQLITRGSPLNLTSTFLWRCIDICKRERQAQSLVTAYVRAKELTQDLSWTASGILSELSDKIYEAFSAANASINSNDENVYFVLHIFNETVAKLPAGNFHF